MYKKKQTARLTTWSDHFATRFSDKREKKIKLKNKAGVRAQRTSDVRLHSTASKFSSEAHTTAADVSNSVSTRE